MILQSLKKYFQTTNLIFIEHSFNLAAFLH